MAVGYEQWTPAPEPTLSYYSSHPGPSYATYNLPSEYTQQPVPTFVDTMSQTYVRELPLSQTLTKCFEKQDHNCIAVF